MKANLILIGIISTLSITLFGQIKTSGKVTYQQTTKLAIKLDGANDEILKMLPQSTSSNQALYFTTNEAFFTNQGLNEDTEINHEKGDSKIKMVFKMPKVESYTDVKNRKSIQATELLGKDFLIEDEVKKYNWKITGEQKLILGYPCQKAINQDTAQALIVWFAPTIPVNIGPGDYNGLPGLILAVEQVKDNKMTLATKIEELPAEYQFVKPTTGAKTNRKDFEKLKEEKMKEMGGNGKTRIFIRNESGGGE
jgi:GLPGLI family protein